jgi:hypothetical protein
MKIIKKRTNEVNKLRGLDWVRWKHEITHINDIKRDIDTGKRIYHNVAELLEALNPAPLPEYTQEGYVGPRKKTSGSQKPQTKVLRWLGDENSVESD